MTVTTLRPGLLVSLNTRVQGNVSYRKAIIEEEHITDEGTQMARWETERTVLDPVEAESAKKIRGKARSLITSVCAASAFGLLCRLDRQGDLEDAIAEARRLADEFNATAALSRVTVYVITGRVADNDVEAVRAINSEVRDLLEQMKEGVETLNVEAVRQAANKARSLGNMLTPDAADRIQGAIDAARSAARKIVAAGEQVACEIDLRAVRAITEARLAFLDLDDAREVAAPTEQARAVDFEPVLSPEEEEAALRRAEAEHAAWVAGQMAEAIDLDDEPITSMMEG